MTSRVTPTLWLTFGTRCVGKAACQRDALQFAMQHGTESGGKNRANQPTVMGQEGGTEVRTLSQDRPPEKNIEALLALLEQPSAVGITGDSVAQFVMEHGLEPGRVHGAHMYDLYRMYEAWADGEAGDPRFFVRKMGGMGFVRGPRKGIGNSNSYAVMLGPEGARLALQWVKEHPAEYGYGLKFRQRMLMGHK